MRHLLHICFLWLLLTDAYSVCAQSRLSVFDVDASVPPAVHARFIALDASEKMITGLTAADFHITEDGIDIPNITVQCDNAASPRPVSLSVSVDISGSMNISPVGGMPPIALATTFVRELAGIIPLPASDLALQSCDSWPVINRDFTTDRTAFVAALDVLQAGGGNDFAEQLLNPSAGLLSTARTGTRSRVAMLLTDAYWGALPASQIQQCIDSCQRHGIRFYAVVFSPAGAGEAGIKASLRTIAEATGGRVVEGVTNSAQSRELAREILGEVQGMEPCRIEWQTRPACRASRTAIIELPAYGIRDTVTYTVNGFNPAEVTRLEITPPSIAFGQVLPGSTRDTTITLTARGGAVTVGTITRSGPPFTIVSGSTPPAFTLQDGESRSLVVRFAPADSSLAYAQFTIASDACTGGAFYTSGGFYRIGTPQLKLLSPNGGEEFTVGADTVITWSGVLPNDPVKLEYSIDAGATWTTIAEQATGLRYPWKVPATLSRRCLMRVTQLPGQAAIMTLGGHKNGVTAVDFTSDGKYALTVDNGEGIRVWDLTTGLMISNLYQPLVKFARFSPDGNRIAMVGGDKTARIVEWRTKALTVLQTAGIYEDIDAIAFSPDGVAVTTIGARIYRGRYVPTELQWNASTGTITNELELGPEECCATFSVTTFAVAYSPDGSEIVTAPHTGDQYVTLAGGTFPIIFHDSKTGAIIRTLDFGGFVYTLDFSADGSMVMAAGWKGVKIWKTSDLSLILSFPQPHGYVDFSPDGKSVAVNGFPPIVDVFIGIPALPLIGHTAGTNCIRFSADGRRIITGSADKTAKIWDLDDSPFQSDVSDSLWAIVASSAESHDVDFGKVTLGDRHDSTIASFVHNTGTVPVHVSSLHVSGPDGVAFSILAGDAPFDVLPGDSAVIELRFAPLHSGAHLGAIDIRTQDGVLQSRLTGEGVASVLELATSFVDFGRVGVGDQKDTTVNLLVKNIGGTPVTITATSDVGPDRTQFSLIAGGGTFTLAPDETRDIRLRFAPLSVGRTSGGISFHHAGGHAVARLFGEGVAGLLPAIEVAATPEFQSIVCDNNSAEASVDIRNAGGATLTVSKATITGVDASAFSFASTFSGLSIPPGERAQLVLVFTPTHAGGHNAALELEGNAANGSPYSIMLYGIKESVSLTPSLTSIDLGTLCPGESVDTTLTLANTGSVRTGVMTTVSAGITLNQSAWTLDTSRSVYVSVHWQGSTIERIYQDTIVFIDTICGNETRIPVTAHVEMPRIEAYPLEMHAQPGGFADTLLSLSNPTGHDIIVNTMQSGSAEFSILPSDYPLLIPPHSVRMVMVHYQPVSTQASGTVLTLAAEPCNVSASVPVSGRPDMVAAEAVFALPVLEGKPGDIIDIPIALRSGTNLQDAKVSGYSGTLRFNAMLLAPIEQTPVGVIDAGERVIPLSLPVIPLHDSTLMILRFRAMLGNDTVTTLRLEGLSAIGGSAGLLTVPGVFVLKGVCTDGGARLLNVEGQVALKAILPNPADGLAVIDYQVVETGKTRLVISDLLGQTVAVLLDDEVDPGSYGVTADVSALSTGLYWCTLKTPTTIVSRPIVVRR